MWYNDDIYTLASGKDFYANNGIVGLAPGRAAVSEGYDGTAIMECNERPCWSCYEDPPEYLSPAEVIEIADYMIALWAAWRDKYKAQT